MIKQAAANEKWKLQEQEIVFEKSRRLIFNVWKKFNINGLLCGFNIIKEKRMEVCLLPGMNILVQSR